MIVCIVEDDSVMALMESLVFPILGDFTCRIFNSARDVMRPGPWEPDPDGNPVHVALIDFQLGGRHTGADVLRYLIDHQPHVRRVLTTAGTLESIPEEDRDLADAVVLKPWVPERMVEVLRG